MSERSDFSMDNLKEVNLVSFFFFLFCFYDVICRFFFHCKGLTGGLLQQAGEGQTATAINIHSL